MHISRAFFPSVYSPQEQAIYCLGGRNLTGDLDNCERYCIIQNKWTFIKPLPSKWNGSAALILDNSYIFCFGGSSEERGSLTCIDQYYITYDKWDTLKIALLTPLSDLSVFPLRDNRVLILGGMVTYNSSSNT